MKDSTLSCSTQKRIGQEEYLLEPMPHELFDRLREMRDEKKLSQDYIEKAKRVASLLLFPEWKTAILFRPLKHWKS